MDIKEFKKQFQKKKVEELPNTVSSNPMVSVCIQTYKHFNYIEKCLESVLMQETNFSLEILLGEDFSNDGTREICIEYARKFPDKIKLFLHERENNIAIDGVPTGRFNFMYNLYAAKGKYIALCEGDDYWTDPLKLQKQFDFLERNQEYSLTHHDAKIIGQNDIILSNSKLPNFNKKDFTSLALKKGPFLLTLSLFFRNSTLIKNPPFEIFDVLNGDKFLISLIGHSGKGKYMNNIAPAVYRSHAGGMWSEVNKITKRKNLANTYRQLGNFYGRQNIKDLYKYFLKKYHKEFSKILKFYISKKDWKNYSSYIRTTHNNYRDFPTIFKSSFDGMAILLKNEFINKN